MAGFTKKKSTIFAKKREKPQQQIKRLKQSIQDSSKKIAQLKQVKAKAKDKIKEICSTISKGNRGANVRTQHKRRSS